MKKLAFLLFAPVWAGAQSPSQDFKLKGELKSFKPIDKIYFSYANGDSYIKDSSQAKNGIFQFEGKLVEPTKAELSVKYVQKEGEKTDQEYTLIFLEPGKMEIVAHASLKNKKVSGSKGEADFENLEKKALAYSQRLEKLYSDYSAARKAGSTKDMDRIEKEIKAVDEEMREKIYGDFIRKTPQSPVAVYALMLYAGYEMDASKVEPLFYKLPLTLQQLPSAVAFKERIDIAKKSAIGSYAMDFTQNDTLGNPVSLSSFRGKYVLVDFWASWCKPCRAENPNVVKAFNRYKDKSFTVIGISLDGPTAKEKWLKAIHDDGLTWTQLSDLKFWNNEVARQYGIRSIPQNLLIDPKGKIIAKNLRGEELDKKLAEIL